MSTLNEKARCYYDACNFYKAKNDNKAAWIAYTKYHEVLSMIEANSRYYTEEA